MILHGYTSTYLDEKKDTDDVDGGSHAYTLIWNGSEWSSKLIDSSINKSEPKLKIQKQPISPVLQGIQSSILFIPRNNDGLFWGILCCFIGNSMLLAVIISIYVLVNFEDSFRYKPNILNNNVFCSFTITLILNAILSPICLILLKKNCLSRLFKNISSFLALIMIAILPVVSWTFLNKSVLDANIQFFTIQTFHNGSLISTTDPVRCEQCDFQDKYLNSDIYWDITCQQEPTPGNKMFFINDSHLACKDVISNKLPYIAVVDDINLRSRSPSYNKMMNKDFIELQSDVNRSGALFTSNKELTPDTVDQYISCSDSDKIYITNDSNDRQSPKLLGKTINGDGVIEEKMSVIIDNIKHYRNIQCKKIPENINIFNDSKALRANNIEQDDVKVCCLNSTHSKNTYGSCSRPFSNLSVEHADYIRERNCNEKQHNQNFVIFFRIGLCIYKFGFIASCSNYSRIQECFFDPCSSVLINNV